MWNGHPSSLDEKTIEKALAGALPKPLFEFPSSASAVRSALAKRNYADALAAADKISEADKGPDLKRAVQGLVTGRVSSMQAALAEGDFLTALEAATALKKDLAGLPEAPDAEKVLATIKENKESQSVIDAQKKIRAMLEQRLGKRREYEKAVADLEKIKADLKGTFAATEATGALATIKKRKGESR